MSQMALMSAAPLAYREGQALTAGQRAAALVIAAGLHVAVIGGFVVAQLRDSPPPPEKTLEVSFISEAQAAATPAPPQAVEPTPAPQTPAPATPQAPPTVMATPTPTPSPMSAPPIERVAPMAPAAPAPAAQPSPPQAAPAVATAAAATAPASTPPSFKAAYLNNPGPVYPQAARMKRQQGVTRLRVQVGADGAPIQVLLDKSSGHSDLDKSAMDVVRNRWRFAPATEAGRPVVGWVVVPMEFSITSR
jgi:protein TonB